MPNIKTYDQPSLGLNPTEVGVEATARAAGRAGAFFNQVASATEAVGNQFARGVSSAVRDAGDVVVRFAEHKEISQGAAAYAALNDRLTQQWNERAKTADPNDPTVAAKFREEVLEPELEKYRGGFLTEGGQKFAEARVDNLRNHMFEKTAADMSSLAAKAVETNMRTTANSLSNTAMRDPTAVPHLLAQSDALVNDLVESAPNLKGAASAKVRMDLTERMKENIVKAGAVGAIQNSPDPEKTAQEWGAKYPQYINGAELKQLAGAARTEIRARRVDAAYTEHLQEKAAQKASDARETDYLQRLYSDDPKEQGQVSTRAIVNDPALNRVAKERMLGIVNREMKPETAAQESNDNYVRILEDIRSGKITDINDIYKARIDNKINRADFNQARQDFIDFRSPEGQRVGQAEEQFITAVKPMIDKSNPLMGKVDQDGPLNVYRLRMDIKRKVEEYRKAGKDWRDLFDPSKPDFMGKPESIAPYQKPLSQSVSDTARRLTGGAVTPPNVAGAPPLPAPKIEPRKPGESPADYLKRTGGR